MSSIAYRYADFGLLEADGTLTESVPIDRVEDQKLAAFEDGYQAGWTDAEKNRATEQRDIGENFLQELRDQSFGYQEALSRLSRGLKPMFEKIVEVLLPEVVSAAVGAHVVDQLMQLTSSQVEGEVTLRVSEHCLPILEELLEGVDLAIPVTFKQDSHLSPQQVFVSLETVEREINLDAVRNEIVQALKAFNFHNQTEHSDA